MAATKDRPCPLSARHNGQMATPEVESHREGDRYVVSWRVNYGAGNGVGSWRVISGEFWECVRQLEGVGIHVEDLK